MVDHGKDWNCLALVAFSNAAEGTISIHAN